MNINAWHAFLAYASQNEHEIPRNVKARSKAYSKLKKDCQQGKTHPLCNLFGKSPSPEMQLVQKQLNNCQAHLGHTIKELRKETAMNKLLLNPPMVEKRMILPSEFRDRKRIDLRIKASDHSRGRERSPSAEYQGQKRRHATKTVDSTRGRERSATVQEPQRKRRV